MIDHHDRHPAADHGWRPAPVGFDPGSGWRARADGRLRQRDRQDRLMIGDEPQIKPLIDIPQDGEMVVEHAAPGGECLCQPGR